MALGRLLHRTGRFAARRRAVVLGVWAVIAPWALSFSGTAGAVTAHVIAGLIVAVLAAIELWFVHNQPVSRV